MGADALTAPHPAADARFVGDRRRLIEAVRARGIQALDAEDRT